MFHTTTGQKGNYLCCIYFNVELKNIAIIRRKYWKNSNSDNEIQAIIKVFELRIQNTFKSLHRSLMRRKKGVCVFTKYITKLSHLF